MAAGNGFSTSPMGFNKNEVNEYIASISKRMSELEAEKREIEKKYESVKKVVDGADDKVRLAETEAKERIEKLEEQLRIERKNSEDLVDQVDELKRKLKNAMSSAGAKPSGGAPNTAAAEKQAASIIAAAEKTAKDTVAKANRTAEEVVQKAKKTASDIMSSTGGASKGVDLSGFMAQLRSFADSVNSGCKTLLSKAEELSGGEGGAAVEMPDFSSFEAPKAETPEFDAPDMSFGSEKTAENDSSGGMDDINALLASMAGDSADSGDDMDAGFGFAAMDDIMGGAASDDSDMSGDLMGFDDLDAGLSEDEPDVPEDISSGDGSESVFDLDFGGDMLSGFGDDMSSGQADDDMTGDVTSDLADAVEADDVKAGDSDLDFGVSNEMDEMQKLLEQAELTFGGGSSEFEERTADVSDDAVDDWSSLQNELDALEKNNDLGMGAGMDSASDGAPANDIWSLGDMDMNESDDDMSSDLFGSF
ncbi:MAG: hypothetical protein J1F28_02170 [Oscillospiraceae bacterium]|nr:hypothetical protein [Oscillospiraceae bacterium]